MVGEQKHLQNTSRHHVILSRRACQPTLSITRGFLLLVLYCTRLDRQMRYFRTLRWFFVWENLTGAPCEFPQFVFLKLNIALLWSSILVLPFLPNSLPFCTSSCPSTWVSSAMVSPLSQLWFFLLWVNLGIDREADISPFRQQLLFRQLDSSLPRKRRRLDGNYGLSGGLCQGTCAHN